jgi:hypothetical protein
MCHATVVERISPAQEQLRAPMIMPQGFIYTMSLLLLDLKAVWPP